MHTYITVYEGKVELLGGRYPPNIGASGYSYVPKFENSVGIMRRQYVLLDQRWVIK